MEQDKLEALRWELMEDAVFPAISDGINDILRDCRKRIEETVSNDEEKSRVYGAVMVSLAEKLVNVSAILKSHATLLDWTIGEEDDTAQNETFDPLRPGPSASVPDPLSNLAKAAVQVVGKQATEHVGKKVKKALARTAAEVAKKAVTGS